MPDQTPSPRATDRLRDIQQITDAALAHLEVEDLLDTLLERVREILQVDTATVLLLDERSNSLVATASRGIEEEVIQGVRIPVGVGFAGRIAAERRAGILDHVDSTTVRNPILSDRGIKAMLGVPLFSAGEVLGVLHIGTLHPRVFTNDDVELLQVAADRVALAARSRLSDRERSAAVSLQHSLLPGKLPLVSGIDFAARYVPGEAEGVGGDWYDVFAMPNGSLCIVMGDVVGRGLRAAVVMGRLRSTLRAYAITSDDPANVLSLVDRKLQYFEPGEMATALMAVFDTTNDRLTISTAGHPAPVLAHPDGTASVLELPVDPPLGVRHSQPRRVTELDLPRGSLLCLYTDGLIERRTVSFDERLEKLREVVTVDTPEAVCSNVMRRLVGADAPADDIALLVVRFEERAPGDPLDLHLPAVSSSLMHVRTALRRWLRDNGAAESAVVDLVVAVGEATSNAVEHAYGLEGGVFSVNVQLQDADAVVRISDTGQWRDPRGADRGRGTLIMQMTTDEFHVDRGPAGTEVVLRRRIDR
jgi:anti-sigma regulatory factor (Ser/Thr protein kinase)/putative methionine-R-sulfoxide reductase with GAF domain